LTLSTPKTLTERLYARARKWTLDWKLHLVQQLVPNSGSILDLGCGTGEFLSALMPFYTVEGIEPEARAAQFAAQHFGMNVHAGTLKDIAVNSAPFDLITLWHVLEHIPDPVEAVRKLQTLLKPGGKLLIALPNVGSLDARWYGADWVALDAPRHLWHFTPQTLKSLLEGNGFHPVIQKMLPLDTFYNSLMSEGLILRRGGRLQYVALPFRAALYVTASLLNGALTGSHSGMVYIFESRK